MPHEKLRPYLHLHSSFWGGQQESFGLGHHGHKVQKGAFLPGQKCLQFPNLQSESENRIFSRRLYSPHSNQQLDKSAPALQLRRATFCVVYFLLIFYTIYVAQAVLELMSSPSLMLAQPHLARTYFSWGFAINQMPSTKCSLICRCIVG